jgi:hypothetical protein
MVRPCVAPPGLSVGVSFSRLPTAYAVGYVLTPLPGLLLPVLPYYREGQCMVTGTGVRLPSVSVSPQVEKAARRRGELGHRAHRSAMATRNCPSAAIICAMILLAAAWGAEIAMAECGRSL